MYRPVNNDRPFSGVCLAESFARLYADENNIMTGIIPCADGDTSLDDWQEGSLLYDNAVNQARWHSVLQKLSEFYGIRAKRIADPSVILCMKKSCQSL